MKTEKEIAVALLSHARDLIALNVGNEEQMQALDAIIQQLSRMSKPLYEPIIYCPCCGRDIIHTCECLPEQILASIEQKKSQTTK